MFDVLDIGASGLFAQRVRMDTIANNVANINTTRNEAGENVPFRRRMVMLSEGRSEDPSQPGVRVSKIEQDPSPFRRTFDPGHPDADTEGYVNLPNIDMSIEFVNMLEASRAYEANITMMETSKQMLNATLRLLA
jgi:flagellar basal-body rod protein FlgC